MHFEEELVNELARIANALSEMNKREALLPRRFPANGENRDLSTDELYDWWGSFTQQQRNFLNGQIKSRILASIADDIAPMEPAVARFIRNYI